MPQNPPPAELQDFIRRRYGDRASDLERVGAGEWSQAYAGSLDGEQVVVRFGAHGEDFAKDRLMAAYRSDVLPIPEVLDLGEAPGGFFVVARRAYGHFLDDLDEAGMRAALPALLRALDVTRAIDVSATSGFGGWRPTDRTAPYPTWRTALLSGLEDRPGGRTHGWRAALEASPTRAGMFDEGVQALRSLVSACPDRREIIHGDLLNRNVLVSGERVSAVLDWGNSMYGDGLYDLAWLLYWWSWYPAWRDIDIAGIIAAHLHTRQKVGPDIERRLRCYQVHIGLDAQAYNAFTRRFDELAANGKKTLALL